MNRKLPPQWVTVKEKLSAVDTRSIQIEISNKADDKVRTAMEYVWSQIFMIRFLPLHKSKEWDTVRVIFSPYGPSIIVTNSKDRYYYEGHSIVIILTYYKLLWDKYYALEIRRRTDESAKVHERIYREMRKIVRHLDELFVNLRIKDQINEKLKIKLDRIEYWEDSNEDAPLVVTKVGL